MRKLGQALLLTTLATALTGCGMTGTWSMKSIEPEAAAGSFEFGRITLKDDGTFDAVVDYGAGKRDIAGDYEYNKAAEELKFTSDGREQVYTAKTNMWCNEMYVKGVTADGTEWVATLKRK